MIKQPKLTSAEVEHIAHLARLPISESEINSLTDELSQTTAYIEVLNDLDTNNIIPTSQVNNKKNVFREDIVLPSLTQKQALSRAKDSYQGFFITTATINKK